MLKFSQVTPPSLSIAVLSGGDSSEREISLASGQAIQQALEALGHCCTAIDPAATDLDSVNWLDFDVAAIGLTESPKQKPLPYIVAFVCQLIMAWMLAGLIGHLGDVTVGRSLGARRANARHRLPTTTRMPIGNGDLPA